MSLSEADLQFVQKRSRLVSSWPWAGAGILILLLALFLWLWLKVPFMINPWVVANSLETGSLADSTMMLMAALLPVVMLLFLFFAATVVLLLFVAFANEKRLLRIVQKKPDLNGF